MDRAKRLDNDDPNEIKHEEDTRNMETPNDLFIGDQEETGEDHDQDDGEAIDDLSERISAILDGAGEEYDPGKEPLPDVPAYRPAFRRVETLGEMLFEQAACVFERSEYSDEFTQRLLRSIEDLKTPHYRDAKVLAFYGDSGVGMLIVPPINYVLPAHLTPGKSSLINSILDSPCLSPKVRCFVTPLRLTLTTE